MRLRFIAVAVVLLATVTAVTLALRTADKPANLQQQLTTELRTTFEHQTAQQHHHAQQTSATTAPLICGVRVYGYEPADATTLSAVRTVYAFHLCGVAEPKQPWDVAVKLAGPVIVDRSTHPPGLQVVEATENVKYVDRLRQMFPDKYAQLALTEALTSAEMSDLRARYSAAAA